METEEQIFGCRSNKTRRETAVKGTSDSSIVSKCSTASCGYFDDPFLHHFVSKITKRAPLIHRGYYIRAAALDKILKNFLKQHKGSKKQIISLGCGFDSSFFKLKASNLLENTQYYEIDFPDVVHRKRLLIENTIELSNLVEKIERTSSSPHLELQCVDYNLLGLDLTQVNTLEAALKMCGLDFDIPTLLFSECVMTYMTRRCSSELVKWAAETFESAIFAIYEQTNPDDAFGIFMQNHFHSIGSPLKCIKAFPTLDSHVKRFKNAGWPWCEAVDMNGFCHQNISPEEHQRVDKLEAFDEYEELNLKYAHYFLLVASTDKDGTSLLAGQGSAITAPSCPEVIQDAVSTTFHAPLVLQSVRRFGHHTAQVSPNYAITTGGFGEIDGRHQRLTEITVTDLHSLQSYHLICSDPHIQYSRMHHASCTMADGTLYLVGGRQSPFFMCNQMLKLRLIINSDDENTELSHSNSDSNSNSNSNLNSNSKSVSSETSNCSSNSKSKIMRQFECNSTQKQFLNSEDDLRSASDLSNSNCEANGSFMNPGNEKFDSSATVGEICQSWGFDLGDLEVKVVEQHGDVPGDRWRHGMVTVTHMETEKLFLYGGKSKAGAVLEDSYLFDPSNNIWKKVGLPDGPSPGPRHSHCLSVWAGQVVLSGGLDGRHVPVGDLWVLDLGTWGWRRMDVLGGMYPRYSHTAHVTDDCLTLVGGVNALPHPPGVAIVDLLSGQIQEFSLPKQQKDNLVMLHRHSSLMDHQGKVLVFGGGGNCFSFGTHLNKTPITLSINHDTAGLN